ncbi:MAG: RHS repeat-associated core domain-containing protein [Cellulomonas sp.]|nr:RHS repeat-associated core domain-containing protein [Cellulomonas sp.]MCR6649342.1 RHS repeat-associated core domain-containing protein [Cellulomonas sp.]
MRDKNGLGGVTSLVSDPHGTTLAAIPNTRWAANSVVKQYTDPFGAARGTTASIPGDRQFLDKTRDTATGLTMVGARYYDEANGRFISVDPLLDLADPQQWNAYAYANNNPTTLSDPSGLTPRIDDDYDGGRAPWPSDPLPPPCRARDLAVRGRQRNSRQRSRSARHRQALFRT